MDGNEIRRAASVLAVATATAARGAGGRAERRQPVPARLRRVPRWRGRRGRRAGSRGWFGDARRGASRGGGPRAGGGDRLALTATGGARPPAADPLACRSTPSRRRRRALRRCALGRARPTSPSGSTRATTPSSLQRSPRAGRRRRGDGGRVVDDAARAPRRAGRGRAAQALLADVPHDEQRRRRVTRLDACSRCGSITREPDRRRAGVHAAARCSGGADDPDRADPRARTRASTRSRARTRGSSAATRRS